MGACMHDNVPDHGILSTLTKNCPFKVTMAAADLGSMRPGTCSSMCIGLAPHMKRATGFGSAEIFM